MKLQLVYEEPYAGYGDADAVKSPSPVPRTVRRRRGPLRVQQWHHPHQGAVGHRPCLLQPANTMRASSLYTTHAGRCALCAGHPLLPMHACLRLLLPVVEVDSLSKPFIGFLFFVQVPWTLMIVMPPNEKFVTVFNARLTNTSADGVSSMVVSDEWQTLQANRANAADVSFLVDASSQARLLTYCVGQAPLLITRVSRGLVALAL